MSTAPTHQRMVLEGEIRELERSRYALEQGLAEAKRGEQRTRDGLAALRQWITTRTRDAVPDPDDKAIPLRIVAVVESVCAAAGRALDGRWAEIRDLINEGSAGVGEQLSAKQGALRRLEGQLLGGGHADEGRASYVPRG